MTLYGLLWGVTAVWGIRDVRRHYESLPGGFIPPEGSAARLILMDSFDPDRFRYPGKDRMLLYFGRFRAPAPFVVTLEIAEANEARGHATRLLFRWWMGDFRLFREETYWRFGEDSNPGENR